MDLKMAGTWLVAPNIRNASCSHPRYTTSLIYYVGIADSVQALLILLLTLGILSANLLVIVVINNRRYTPYIQQQPRYLLTSLALNDFAIGLLITPFGVLPALFHCWPFGEIYCQIQALLRGALSQQSAVILVCMAIDRYMCAIHPDKYQQHSSKKGCVVILSVTWTLCLTLFGMLVLPKGYYFNSTGLLVCEPFYSKPSYRILATCSLYFPTTMILMYCYGSSFHASSFRLVTKPQSNGPSLSSEKVFTQERRLSGSASRTMAAMSLGFIVMVTPWTIQEVVAACTGSKVPPFLDFLVTWTAISNSFWNPFLYWLLNAHFRRISRDLIFNRCWASDDIAVDNKTRCCSISSECGDPTTILPKPPGPPASQAPRNELADGLSEKYWGEILERTVSSNSLHALQRIYGLSPHRQQPPQPPSQHQHQTQSELQHPLPTTQHHHTMKSGFHDMNGSSDGFHMNATTTKSNEIGSITAQTLSTCYCTPSTTQNCTNCSLTTTAPNGNHQHQHQHHHHPHHQDKIDDDDETDEDANQLSNVFSNSEPHLCEHLRHEQRCARSQVYFKESRNAIEDI